MWDVLTDRQNLSGSMDLGSLSPEVPKGSEQKQSVSLPEPAVQGKTPPPVRAATREVREPRGELSLIP